MTIKEVAKYANVSVATVSRVLNDDPKVKKETYDAVKKAIEKTGYVVNEFGRSLRTAKSNVILVVLPQLQNPFYAEVVRGIEDKCRDYGYNVLVCNVYERHDQMMYYCEYIDKKLVQGAILISPVWKRDYSFLKGRPVITCFESGEDIPAPKIDIDNVRAGYDATKYLITQGAKEIAVITGGDYTLSSMERREGFFQAMKEAGLKIDEKLVLEEYFEYDDGLQAAEKILDYKKPDAVFAASDELGIAFINKARERGYNIPEDVMVVGFDNIRYSTFSRPALTTVEQPKYEIGVCAAEQLMAVLDGKKVGNVIFPHKIVERESTKKGDNNG